MGKQSAGLLVFRIINLPEVLLVHPGGPFYVNKDSGVWSVPKGEYEDGINPLYAAKREFFEETGNKVRSENFIELGPVRSKGGKTVQVWAVEEDFERSYICSNTFELEWPPRSGKTSSYPECDRAEWFTLDEAMVKLYDYQRPLIEELKTIILKN